MRAIVLTVVILLLTSCADSNMAGQDPHGGGDDARPSGGPIYTRVTDCTPFLGSEARSDLAYNSPPHGMALATWQQIIDDIYVAESKLDRACVEGRFFVATISGRVTQYRVGNNP